MLDDLSVITDPPLKQTVIKVIGCGGGGSNAVNRMIEVGIQHVEFIVLNTDLQALSSSKASKKIGIGSKLTGGLGAGGKPEVGEAAALEDKDQIENVLKGANMVFITVGMGGGTGTGAAPVVANIARSLGALTVGVVTKPFDFEGKLRMQNAERGIEKLHKEVDSLIVIPNQNLFKVMEKKAGIEKTFLTVDDVLRQGVQGISEVITKTGLINLDYNDVRTTMEGKGDAIMGIGFGKGENRATDAATQSINNPMLEDSRIDGAKNILVNITSNQEISIFEVDEIVQIIKAAADPDVHLIYGHVLDNSMDDGVFVTVIATGFTSDPVSEPIEATKTATQNDMTNTMSLRDFTSIKKASLSDGLSSSMQKTPPDLFSSVEQTSSFQRESKGTSFSSSVGNSSNNGPNLSGRTNIPPSNDIKTPAYLRNRIQLED